ncbi:MAG: Coenzyme F420 hydrogenase/dehydrogenase, beta subunit C-terminal domain [Candidatus Caldarchaeum sp.]|uniref:4Fe-4S dicluster domain-containing protein n=1 Tax=Caldiarchaeum subterraneum TaxID=311458 RepID=A0A7J3VSI4_CALS0
MRSTQEILKKLERIERQYLLSMRNTDDPKAVSYYYGWHHALEWVRKRGDQVIVDEVVGTGRCSGCAACVAICPTNVFDYVEDRPINTRLNHCIDCDLCVESCPELHLSDVDVEMKSLDSYASRDDGFGRYGDVYLTRSARSEILKRSQDGGTVSSILVYCLEKGLIDAAVVSTTTPEKPLYPVARLVFSPQEVLECAGSRYTYAPNLLALREAYERGVDRLAVVGVPCQIDGLRYLQHSTPDLEVAKWYEKHVVFSIGLFCSEVFTYQGLMRYFDEVKVDSSMVEKINIKGKVIITMKNGEEIVKPLKQLHKYERPACRFCKDYSAELADIACGGLATKGWTITVLRTRPGLSIVESAIRDGMLEAKPISLEDEPMKLLRKLCLNKRERPSPPLKTMFSV